jgi:UDP-N-acetylmuramoyl-L-alanyl-D-glutamate--2,6-diaminopimelate ligase
VGDTEPRCSGPRRRSSLSVNIRSLLDEIDVVHVSGDPDLEVSAIEHDSRRVEAGALFCCVPGDHVDGHEFAAQAVERGAVGVVCERAVNVGDADVVQVRVPPGRARTSMAKLASAFFGHPSRQLVTAGVTGTNGKTTVSHLLGAVLNHVDIPTLVIGTITGARTTPEATELQALLAAERDKGLADHRTHAVSMEVSSHALAQSRVDGITFDLAIFTNLSHEHLDFHKTMEAYFEAKASLFTPEHAAQGIVFADDPAGQRLLERARIPLRPVRRSDAAGVELGLGWSRFIWRGLSVEVALSGRFNIDNALLAAESALELGVEPDDVAIALSEAPAVPGRMELVAVDRVESGPRVLVDYAHTPAGLESVLSTIGELRRPGDRVVVVFGCGGNRDQAKRPLMGRLAVQMADLVVVTSDNPRDEDPLVIIEQIKSGIDTASRRRAEVLVEPDRRQAIALAVGRAAPGDVVLIAGRGHETHQELGGERVPFDDRAVAREVLACSP